LVTKGSIVVIASTRPALEGGLHLGVLYLREPDARRVEPLLLEPRPVGDVEHVLKRVHGHRLAAQVIDRADPAVLPDEQGGEVVPGIARAERPGGDDLHRQPLRARDEHGDRVRAGDLHVAVQHGGDRRGAAATHGDLHVEPLLAEEAPLESELHERRRDALGVEHVDGGPPLPGRSTVAPAAGEDQCGEARPRRRRDLPAVIGPPTL
jgi:hypothetical protein